MDKTQTAVAAFDRWATEYQNKFMDLSLYHDSFDLFCQFVEKEGAEVLELACGPGNITQYLLKKCPDLNILGTDLSPKMLELARANNPTARFEIMDCRAISQLNKKYAAIMCGFCLPYLSKTEAVQLIADAAGILQPNGVFYISTMEDDYEKSGLKGSSSNPDQKIFIHYHQADYLAEALQKNGFEILSLHRQNYPDPSGTDTLDLLIIAKLNPA